VKGIAICNAEVSAKGRSLPLAGGFEPAAGCGEVLWPEVEERLSVARHRRGTSKNRGYLNADRVYMCSFVWVVSLLVR
jgi:hypothetical protein